MRAMTSILSRATTWLAAALVLALAGCDLFGVDDRPDPNGPSLEDILASATESQMRDLATGAQAGSREDLDFYLIDVGMIGREYWRFSSADPRYTGDLLGKSTSILDNNTFYITRPWGSRYAAVRDACTLLQALDVTSAPLSDAQKAAARGFANTWIAYQILLNLNLTWDNGVRIDVCDPDVVAPVVAPAEAALADLAALLDNAAADLQSAVDAEAGFFFPVRLTPGGDEQFDTPATYLEFNRTLAARIAVYRERWEEALQHVEASFLDRAGANLTFGAYHLFSTAAGDLTNPFVLDPQNAAGDAVVAHPSFLSDMEEGDQRASKVQLRVDGDGNPNPATFDGLTGSHGVFVYKSNSDPIPIIRAAELVLIRAEANIQLGNLGPARNDLDRIRNAAGLDGYDGPNTQAALLDEMLRQRRFELYGEGHRWIDLRRYDRLGTLPLDREGDDVWDQFRIPFNENVGG